MHFDDSEMHTFSHFAISEISFLQSHSLESGHGSSQGLHVREPGHVSVIQKILKKDCEEEGSVLAYVCKPSCDNILVRAREQNLWNVSPQRERQSQGKPRHAS